MNHILTSTEAIELIHSVQSLELAEKVLHIFTKQLEDGWLQDKCVAPVYLVDQPVGEINDL